MAQQKLAQRHKEAASSETRQRKARVEALRASQKGDGEVSGLARAREENKEEEAEKWVLQVS